VVIEADHMPELNLDFWKYAEIYAPREKKGCLKVDEVISVKRIKGASNSQTPEGGEVFMESMGET